MLKNISKDNNAAIPPLREIASLWNACGFRKSLSNRIPWFNLWEYLITIKKIKKVINVKSDKKLNSIESVCILIFYTFIIFFYNVNTYYYYNQWN